MTKVLTIQECKALLKEAFEKLERVCQIPDEYHERHETRMEEMRLKTLGGQNENLSIHTWKNNRHGHLRV